MSTRLSSVSLPTCSFSLLSGSLSSSKVQRTFPEGSAPLKACVKEKALYLDKWIQESFKRYAISFHPLFSCPEFSKVDPVELDQYINEKMKTLEEQKPYDGVTSDLLTWKFEVKKALDDLESEDEKVVLQATKVIEEIYPKYEEYFTKAEKPKMDLLIGFCFFPFKPCSSLSRLSPEGSPPPRCSFSSENSSDMHSSIENLLEEIDHSEGAPVARLSKEVRDKAHYLDKWVERSFNVHVATLHPLFHRSEFSKVTHTQFYAYLSEKMEELKKDHSNDPIASQLLKWQFEVKKALKDFESRDAKVVNEAIHVIEEIYPKYEEYFKNIQESAPDSSIATQARST